MRQRNIANFRMSTLATWGSISLRAVFVKRVLAAFVPSALLP